MRAGEKETVEIDTSNQELLSSLLTRKGRITNNELMAYLAQVEAICKLSSKTPEQERFVSDVLSTTYKINARLDKAERDVLTTQAKLEAERAVRRNEETRHQATTSNAEREAGGTTNEYEAMDRNVTMDTIQLNKLVRTPETFDGRRPKPRKWIADYEDAMLLNGWSDSVAVKYFSTFLTDTALAWFKTEIKPLGLNLPWSVISSEFKNYYLGRADKDALSQQVEEAKQRPRESVRDFIPRFRELLLLLDSDMSEEEQQRRIVSRLRPEYKPWLAFAEPKNIRELRECCVKVEAGSLPNEESSTGGRQFARPDRLRTSAHQPKQVEKRLIFKPAQGGGQGARSPGDRSNPLCYRCNRTGHVAKHCRATAKVDGSPCNPKPQARKINTITEPKEVLTIKHVCDVASTDEEKFNVNVVVGGTKLMEHEVEVNGKKFEALMDTGASVSVIDNSIVKKNKWTVIKPGPLLVGADGSQLRSLGILQAELTIKIGKITKRTTTNLAVVAGLASPLIIGLKLLAKMEILIDPQDNKISFKAASSKKGVKVAKSTTVPARAQATVEAMCSDEGTVLTSPFYLNEGLLVGNSINRVIANKILVPVVNTTSKQVVLKEGMQLATYEKWNDDKAAVANNQVARIVELEDAHEVVNIGDHLEEEKVDELAKLLNKYSKVFSANGLVGKTTLIEHSIELLEGAKPFAEPLRRRPLVHVEETKRQVKQLLEDDIIEESKSPWASAYVLAKKKSGEYRLCIDFRRLNNMSKKWVYPLPNTDQCIDTLAGKKYFSLVDFSAGFWQVPMAERSRELTSFRTEEGQFQFKRMPFGLTNAPATFQKMVNALLAGLKGVNLQVFIDDICVASTTWKEHLETLEKVFKLIIEANLKLKGSKCTFAASKVIFLGHEISHDGIRQDPQKLAALLKLPRPRDSQEVKRALGMFSYYRKFVPSFALIAEPLTKLTKKHSIFKWTEREEEAFTEILKQLEKNAVISMFSHTDPTVLKTDASRSGVAGVLLQQREGEWRMVACVSRRLSQSEENYGITDLEGLAVVYSVTKLRHFLLGKFFTILVDHCALCVLKERMPNSPRLRRWAILLSEYDFEVKYTKGKLHEDVDCLSRAPVNDENDNFLEERVCVIALPRNKIQWLMDHDDPESKNILEKARAKIDDLRLANDVVYKGGQLYLPPPRRRPALVDAHDACGHGGMAATKERLETAWWPTKSEDIESFVRACELCQKQRVERAKPAGGMFHHEVFEPNSQVAIDCMGPVAETLRGNKHIIVAIDAFTKFVEAKAVSDVSAATFIDFITEYCGRYGVPRTILTDNASTFTATAAKEVMQVFSIKHLTAAPKHSQGNAVVERAIETLQEKIALLANDRQSEWDVVLPVAVLAINSTRHRATKCTPFELTFGRRLPLQISDLSEPPRSPHELHAELIARQLSECREKVIESQAEANYASREVYLAKRRAREFQVGELVLVRVTERGRQKFSRRFEGPYRVVSGEKDIYKLACCETGHPKVRHVSALKPYFVEEKQVENQSEEQQLEEEQLEVSEQLDRINLIRSSNMSYKSYRKIWALIFIFAVSVNAIVFERVSPIVWTQTGHYVDHGLQSYKVEIRFANPCPQLRVIPALNPAANQKAELHCSSIYAETIERLIEDAVKTIQMVEAGRRIPPPKEKRMITEFVLGMFFSNILKTFTDKIWHSSDDTEIRERQKVVIEKLTDMNRAINVTELLTTAMADNLQHLHEAVRRTNQNLNLVAIDSAELAVTASYMVAKIMIKSHLISRIKYHFKNKRVDLEALNELLENDFLIDLEPTSAIARTISSSGPGVLTLGFAARRRAQETTVNRVEAFRHWANLSTKPTLMEYTGEKFLVWNTTNNCIKAISEPTQMHVTVTCTESNYEDERLASWREIYSTDDFTNQHTSTTVKEGFPYNYVYCPRLQITVKGQTQKCPPYVFRLNATEAFNTTDYKHIPQIQVFELDEAAHLSTDIHSVHFKNNPDMIDENLAYERIAQLQARLKELELKEIAITLPSAGGGVTYASATKMLVILFIMLIIMLAVVSLYQWKNSRRQHETVMRTVVDGLHGNGTYDTISRAKSTSTLNSHVSSSPNIVNVNLREFVSRFTSSGEPSS